MIIDTPGLFDPKEFKMKKGKHAEEGNESKIKCHQSKNPFFFSDLVVKLKAMGSIDGLVLLLNPNAGGRINSNIVNTIKALDFMFEKAECNIMMNLVFAYSKCDVDQTRSYYNLLERRDTEYQQIVSFFVKFGVKMPSDLRDRQVYFLTSADLDSNNIGQEREFNMLLDFIRSRVSIQTDCIANPEEYIQNGSYSREI